MQLTAFRDFCVRWRKPRNIKARHLHPFQSNDGHVAILQISIQSESMEQPAKFTFDFISAFYVIVPPDPFQNSSDSLANLYGDFLLSRNGVR
jgi:hypothetical protein